jgi:hypothetical protein
MPAAAVSDLAHAGDNPARCFGEEDAARSPQLQHRQVDPVKPLVTISTISTTMLASSLAAPIQAIQLARTSQCVFTDPRRTRDPAVSAGST